LKVERWTFDVPDRYTGHRVCPHIWAPQPVSTAGQGLGQVREFKSPVAKTTCLSPNLGASCSWEKTPLHLGTAGAGYPGRTAPVLVSAYRHSARALL